MLKALWKPSSKSTPNYTFNFRVSCLPAWCQCAKVPKGCQLLVFTCQCSNKCANVRKACQLFNLVYQSAKGMPNFQLCMQHAKRGTDFSTIFQKNFSIFQSCLHLQLKCQDAKCRMKLNIFFYLPTWYALCKKTYLAKYTSCTP